MPLLQATYPIASKGLATNFEETALPPDYALRFRNRFINAAGGAEKRHGLDLFSGAIVGTPNLNALHELVNAQTGATTLFASGDGRIWRFNTATSAWAQALDSGFRGSNLLYQSVQMVDRLIFVNGTSRPMFTKNGTTFEELEAIVIEGNTGAGSNTTTLFDFGLTAEVSASTGTGFRNYNATVYDVVHNMTLGSFAAITAVPTSAPSVTHTVVSGQTAGQRYRLIDSVELNIIPTAGEPDNVADAGPGTSGLQVYVSGMSWPGTEIRVGDWIVNTIQNVTMTVVGIGVSALTVRVDTSVANAAAVGDSLIFLKSAMPIPTRAHVHYGRLYMIDSRDQHKVYISGPDDPTDMTTSSGIIDAQTFSFGSQQPTGDILRSITSYQRFLVMAGARFTLLFEGTDPIVDEATSKKDFSPVGLFPQGAKSPQALATIGNDAVVISDDGVQSFSYLAQSGGTGIGQENLSEALKNTLRTTIAGTPESEILVFHYPKRSWVCFKVGTQLFVYNYTPYFGSSLAGANPQQAFSSEPQRGSWSLFDGKFARQKAYLVRQNGTLLCAGGAGQVYTFDGETTFADAGEGYTTEYQTGWLTLDEPRRSLQVKQGHYIQPVMHGTSTVYTIRAEAPFGRIESSDVALVTANSGQTIGTFVIGTYQIGGSDIFDRKFPLRWRGKEMRLTFTTNDTAGPDVISRFTLFINRFGVR